MEYPVSVQAHQRSAGFWRQQYLQMRMKAEIPEGLDWSWIWPNGPLEAVAVQGFPELDALPIEDVLPLLL
ncbi:MAG: hypothetical protein VXZ96_01375, partial [Myxococcota bacterium]|nr:hypothetical protein [Myxococcota bacterium]